MMEEVWGRGGSLLAAALAVVVAIVAGWAACEVVRRRSGRLPPGPWGLPVIGNLLQLLGGELLHRQLAELSKQYGPIVYLKLGTAPTILVSDANSAKLFLSGANDRIFASRPPMEAGRRLAFGPLSSIAMAPYDENWRHARKLCSLELFIARRIKEMEPLRRMEISSLLDSVRKKVGEEVNVTQATGLLVEGMTYRMLLDKGLSDMAHAKMGINLQAKVQHLTEVLQVPMIGDFIPWLGFLDWKTKALLDEIHIAFDLVLDNIIRERRERPQGSTTVILDVLLENVELTQAKGIMADLITAAIDTSATTLDWVMAELLANPQAMRKLQEELEQVGKGEDRILEEAELGSLVYLKAVVKETMRLHIPAPLLLPHMATEACNVGGYSIPKGCRLLVNAWAIGRDPQSWEDPERFLPERFLSEKGSHIDLRGQHFELMPFGCGRRSCPGLPFALPIVESALANLVYSFDWKVPLGQVVDLSERNGAVASRMTPLSGIPSLRH